MNGMPDVSKESQLFGFIDSYVIDEEGGIREGNEYGFVVATNFYVSDLEEEHLVIGNVQVFILDQIEQFTVVFQEVFRIVLSPHFHFEQSLKK